MGKECAKGLQRLKAELLLRLIDKVVERLVSLCPQAISSALYFFVSIFHSISISGGLFMTGLG